MSLNIAKDSKKRVVIVGGGFGGLKLANKLKNKMEANDLDSGRYGGDFFPPTGRGAVYFWGLGATTAPANLYFLR